MRRRGAESAGPFHGYQGTCSQLCRPSSGRKLVLKPEPVTTRTASARVTRLPQSTQPRETLIPSILTCYKACHSLSTHFWRGCATASKRRAGTPLPCGFSCVGRAGGRRRAGAPCSATPHRATIQAPATESPSSAAAPPLDPPRTAARPPGHGEPISQARPLRLATVLPCYHGAKEEKDTSFRGYLEDHDAGPAMTPRSALFLDYTAALVA